MDKKIKLLTDDKEKHALIKYSIIKGNKKDRNLETKEQIKMYDYEFDKRMIKYEN
jgi:hypothetical protein